MCAKFNSFSWYIQSHRCYSHLRLLLVYRMLLLGSSRLHFKHISGESYDGKCSMSESSLCLVLRLVAGIRTIDWNIFEHSDRRYRPKTLFRQLNSPFIAKCTRVWAWANVCMCVLWFCSTLETTFVHPYHNFMSWNMTGTDANSVSNIHYILAFRWAHSNICSYNKIIR